MASPVADAYSAPSGVPVYGGRYAGGALSGAAILAGLSADGGMGTQASEVSGAAVLYGVTAGGGMEGFYVPTWRQGMTPLTWYEVGGNTLNDIRPSNDPAVNPNHPGTAPWALLAPQASLITDWGGGAWDEANQRFWVAGGGHSAYLGNEPYTIDLDADNPVWVMRGYPTGSIQRPVTTVGARDAVDTEVGQDGRPLSVHTYGFLTILSNSRLFLGWGAFAFDSSGTATAEFDPATDDWDMTTGRYTVSGSVAEVLGSVEYDPVRNVVWAVANRSVTRYDVATKIATRPMYSYSGGITGAVLRYMPEHDLFAIFSSTASSFGSGKHVTILDPSSPGTLPPGINATTQAGWSYLHGIDYDQTRKRFLRWGGGGAIETLTPPATNPKTNAWTYGSLTTSTAITTPPSAQPNGTYGRFRFSQKYDCCFLVNSTTGKLFVLPMS